MKNYQAMNNRELENELMEYARARKGEIHDLTCAAALRIAALAIRIRELEGEDDLK